MISEILRRLLYRQPNVNKYDFGHVLILGGSPGMVGAPLLAGEAALRTGAGLVTIASSTDVVNKLEKRVKEIMTFALPKPQGVTENIEALLLFIQKRHVTVVVIGPGLSADLAVLVPELLGRLHLPIVLDAGGLLSFRGHLAWLRDIAAKNSGIVLTPHTGEYEKLTNVTLPQSVRDTQSAVTNFVRQYQVTLVLKGHRTIVAQPDGTLYKNKTGNPGLATAGTGDVLSGVVAGLLAQGVKPGDAAINGVYLHGLAGDLACEAKTEPGIIASDVIAALPSAFKKARALH